jgi:ankyrin repeat protein
METKTTSLELNNSCNSPSKTKDQHLANPLFVSTGTTYDSTFVRSTLLPKIFTESVEQMNAGITRNAFNHFKKNEDGWKECLHELVQPWEQGWDPFKGWSTRKDCTCDACKKVLPRERWNQELSHFDVILEDDSTRTSLLRDMGIRVDVLIAFAIDHNCWDWPTWRVVRDIIQPATKSTRCRYADLPGMKDNNYFGPATVFGSHTWSAPFGNLVAAVSQGASYNRYVWIDIFAVRQWPGNVADLNFRGVIEDSTAMLVSVSPIKELHKHRCNSYWRNYVRVFIGGIMFIYGGVSFCLVLMATGVWDDSDKSTSDYATLWGCAAFLLLFFIPLVWASFRKDGFCWNFQQDFLKTKEGKAAGKNIFFFRLWCVVEVASAVENKIPIIIKLGQAKKNEEGIYAYNTKSLGQMFSNLKDMVDIASSECAVPSDKVREMNLIREKFGEDCNTIINKMVSSVISGAKIAEALNIISVDSASCGEVESLNNLYITSSEEPTRNQTKLATRVLLAACSGGRWRIVKLLLERWKEKKQWLCNVIDSSMALAWAAKLGHTNVVKVLLEIEGIDVNAGNALSTAAEFGQTDIVKLLLETKYGIDINAGNALFLACENNSLEIVDMLLQEDRNYMDVEVEVSNPLEVTVDGGEEVKVCSLIDPNQKSLRKPKQSPLSIAQQKGNTEIVQRLLQHPRINKKLTYNTVWEVVSLYFIFLVLVTSIIIILVTQTSNNRSCVCNPNSKFINTTNYTNWNYTSTCENGTKVFCNNECSECKWEVQYV